MLGDGMVSFGTAVVTCRAQELERVGKDRLLERDPAGDAVGGRRELEVALFVVELDGQPLVGLPDPAEGIDEVHVPRAAPELAVGGRLQPDILLHLDDDRMASSSAARSSSADNRPSAKLARASRSACGRSRLPTWSARNGGVVTIAMSARTSP